MKNRNEKKTETKVTPKQTITTKQTTMSKEAVAKTKKETPIAPRKTSSYFPSKKDRKP